MPDIIESLKQINRPRLLVSAAKSGLSRYQRDRDLRRILRSAEPGKCNARRLLEAEAELENTRKRGDGTYSVSRHIGVLTALMAEVSAIIQQQQAA